MPERTANVFHLSNAGSLAPHMALGKNLPEQIENQPVYYRNKVIARAAQFVHPKSGERMSITLSRIDGWIDAFNRRAAKGIKPYLYPRHLVEGEQPDATKTQGYVIGLSREGENLIGTLQLIGDGALSTAAANDVSITAIADAMDADGEKYAECLHHLAFTPNPVLTGMGGYVKIAASAGGSPANAPVFELAAASTGSSIMLKPETLSKLRKALSLADTVSDADVAEAAAAKFLTPADPKAGEQVATLSAELNTVKGERDRLNQQVLSLSNAAPKEPDALSLSLITRAFKTDRERVIESGVVSEAGMKELDMLMLPNGKPAPFALSLSADSPDPIYSRVCDILRRNPGVKTNHAAKRTDLSAAAPPNHGSHGDTQPTQTAEQLQAAVDANLAMTATGRRALAARKA